MDDKTKFKKPILVGKRGKFPKLLQFGRKFEGSEPSSENDKVTELSDVDRELEDVIDVNKSSKDVSLSDMDGTPIDAIKCSYVAPDWSGLPPTGDNRYSLDVLKNGSIIESSSLIEKSYWIFGRFVSCDICMLHPTVSRFHAVLQYRKYIENGQDNKSGFYLYDLGSTHGTYLNKKRIRPGVYVRMKVGHLMKLGCSTRQFILNGPEEDSDEDLGISVSEYKKKVQSKAESLHQKNVEDNEMMEFTKISKGDSELIEDRGIDWGLGEDADENCDLTENPFAQTNNEELYIDNPKKTLRGFFEREGLDLNYDCHEQGMGQFVCKVELPIDNEQGKPLVAEVCHKGKKKEAVVQCALEACRILDRCGLLRQATHESKKRRPKNWAENDYYDSDEDTFFDRTGEIEQKRAKRMSKLIPQQAETFETLVVKERQMKQSILDIKRQIASAEDALKTNELHGNREDVDTLDDYMEKLSSKSVSKCDIKQWKLQLDHLNKEYANISKLLQVARPTQIPHITTKPDQSTSQSPQNRIDLELCVNTKYTQDDSVELNNTSDNKKADLTDTSTVPQIGNSIPKNSKEKSRQVGIHTPVSVDHIIERFQDQFGRKFNAELLQKLRDVVVDARRCCHHSIQDDPDFLQVLDVLKPIQTCIDKLRTIDDPQASALLLKEINNFHCTTKSIRSRKTENNKRLVEKESNATFCRDESNDSWLPPCNQTGDGKTHLNDKYGY